MPRLVIILLALLITAPAAADVPHTVSKARYAEGMRLYDKKRFEEARASFLQAHALERRPAVTLMLGLSSLKAGRALEALSWFDAYLAEAPDASEKAKALVLSAKKEARSKLGAIKIDAPSDAEVTLDGQRVPALDGPLDVEPGAHTVVVGRLTKTVDVPAGTIAEVRAPRSRENEIEAGPPPPPKPKPPMPIEDTSIFAPPKTSWPVYVAGGIGLVGLAGAAVFGGLSLDAEHSLDVARAALTRGGESLDSCKKPTIGTPLDDVCSIVRRHESTRDAHVVAFRVALGAGITGAAIAAGWYFLAPKERTLVTPWASTTGGGASISGRF